MEDRTEPDEFDAPPQTLGGRVAETIEKTCKIMARIAAPLLIPVALTFLTYVVGGYLAIMLDVWSPSFEFLSLSEDIYFAWLGFLSGVVICIGSGGLVGLAYLKEGTGQIHNEASILASFIGFGFGAGLLRITAMTVFSSLI